MTRATRGWISVVAALLVGSGAALSQGIGASVTGRVLDESRAPRGGASVTARNVGTGWTRTVTSEASGAYRLSELPAGTYEFTVALEGFGGETRTGVRLLVGQEATLDFELRVAGVAETVAVESEVPIVETTKSAVGTTITTRQIDELPLPERDFANLAFLAPGVTQSVTEATTISGSGSSGSSNTFLIDGLSNDQDALGDSRGDFSPDAIAEFEVLSSQYSAEYGQASGAIVNVLTRSGSNALHARVAAYYRADELAASDPFAQRDPITRDKVETPFDQWIVSTFLSGPIRRDTAFFFASYEHTLRNQTAVVSVDPDLLASLGQSTETAVPNDLREPRVLAKVDWLLANTNTLTARFRLDDPTTENFAVGGIFTEETGGQLDTKNRDYALSDSWILSSKALNELRVQFARQSNDVTKVNCPGCPFIVRPSLYTGKLPNFPQKFTEDRFQIIDAPSVSILGGAGDHYLKGGVDYSRVKIDAFVPQNFDGAFIFGTDDPFDPNNAETYPVIWQGATGNPDIDITNNILALFLQDQWRVTPHFTLNLGVRWDYEDQVYVEDDHDNVAPRLHFAWDPFRDGKTSVRGGFGQYYDQVLLNVPLIQGIYEPGRFQFQTVLLPGYPDPFVGGQQIPFPLPPDVSLTDPDTQTPYKNVASIGFQRELTPDTAVSVDAVYARGYHLLLLRDANAPINGERPNPDVGIGVQIQTSGRSRYEALQVGLQRRFTRSFSGTLAYTLASNKDNTDSHRDFISDSNNPDADYGPSLNDIRHTLNAAVNVVAPWGIDVGVMGTYLSAPPYNVLTGDDDNGDGNLNDRPPGVERNSARGDPLWTVNLHLAKSFAIGKVKAQLIGECFNLFNHVNGGSFVENLQSPEFGKPTATAIGFTPRQVQLGIRFDL
jgi:hypothetical protein